ncbi:MAG: phenylalanine--tRNA ligase subunit beta [Crocinitomicaceae bacterium]|nr:phenylalanine--tRNA ligase subunit beta [Crocinitomicaceae bacterium]
MNISYKWLKTYIDTDISANEMARILTDTGLEVEKSHEIEAIPGGLKGLIIGLILKKEKHPDADRLSVCTVDIGQPEALQIICGASNVAEGQKVIVAPVGSCLHPVNGDPFKIKKSKIRGLASHGMICAEDEIGLGKGHEGIMVLDQIAEVGALASSYFNLETDIQFEIGLTPNRADGMSHIGVARDLLCALKHQKTIEQKSIVKWPIIDDFKIDKDSVKLDITVQDTFACPRYAGVSISGVSVGPAPDWLQNRLRSIGCNPVNNIVDATNFVLHELGQPLHAFDLEKIDGNKVIVKKLAAKTSFTTLDGIERKLDDQDLMICDDKEGLCLAGIFGGLSSGVTESTTSIFLESAYFNPVCIRKSAKRHGLNTDASFRFERGIDPTRVVYALKRAALLIKEVAGGYISSKITDIYPEKIADFEVHFNINRLNALAGISIEYNTIINILKSLEIEVLNVDQNKLQLRVPSYRVDVQREIDVIEEVLRIYGFNNIPVSEKVNSSLSYRSKTDIEKMQNIVSDLLAANGFAETMSNSLTKSSYINQEEFRDMNSDWNVAMLNPLSSDLGVLRQSLVFSGLEAIAYNQNRQEQDLKLFEFGKVYFAREERHDEYRHLGIFLTGKKQAEQWYLKPQDVSFYSITGAVNAVLSRLGIFKNQKSAPTKNDLFAEGISISIGKIKVADLGRIKTDLLNKMGIHQAVFYAEIKWDKVLELMPMNKTKFKPLTKFPSVRRDLSLLLDEKISFSEIESIARNSEKLLLKEVGLFDVYDGKNIAAGKKSYGVKFIMQDSERTLDDKRISSIMNKIKSELEEQLGAELR